MIPETASDQDVILGKWTTVKVSKIRATWDIQAGNKMIGTVTDAGRLTMILHGKWKLDNGYLYTSWQLMEKNENVFYLEKMERYKHFSKVIENKILLLDQNKMILKNTGVEEFERTK